MVKPCVWIPTYMPLNIHSGLKMVTHSSSNLTLICQLYPPTLTPNPQIWASPMTSAELSLYLLWAFKRTWPFLFSPSWNTDSWEVPCLIPTIMRGEAQAMWRGYVKETWGAPTGCPIWYSSWQRQLPTREGAILSQSCWTPRSQPISPEAEPPCRAHSNT